MTPKHGYDDLLVGFSVIAVIFAAIGYYGYDIGLASTQWLLVAAVLGIWALYLKIGCKCK